MGKEEILRDILFKVSELKLDVESAEKKIHRLFNDSDSLPTKFEIGNQAVNYAGFKTSASGRRVAFVAGAEWMKQRLGNKL